MASQKIQDKEKSILDAAITVFAARGFWNTPTSLISKTAGVADGTLFNYFASKDDLINAVYLAVKHDLADYMMVDFPHWASFRDKAWHVWSRHVEWGLAEPEKFKVLQQIHVSFEVSEAAKAESLEPFMAFQQAAAESIANGEFRPYPAEFIGALMNSHINTTVEYISMSGDYSTDYKAIGFEILWNGISR